MGERPGSGRRAQPEAVYAKDVFVTRRVTERTNGVGAQTCAGSLTDPTHRARETDAGGEVRDGLLDRGARRDAGTPAGSSTSNGDPAHSTSCDGGNAVGTDELPAAAEDDAALRRTRRASFAAAHGGGRGDGHEARYGERRHGDLSHNCALTAVHPARMRTSVPRQLAHLSVHAHSGHHRRPHPPRCKR